jgi:hypothetical protein
MHRTLKAGTATPPRANLRQQQLAFERFEQEYNYERPHEALGNRTPAEVYAASARSFPQRLPELEYPAGVMMRRISQQGSLKWRGERTLLSEVLERETVGLLEVEEDLYEVEGKYSIFDGGTRVPMIARWPGHIAAAATSGALISQVDLLSPFADLAEQKVPQGAAPDSVDVLQAILGRSKTRAAAWWSTPHTGLIEGDWKFIGPGKGPTINRNTRYRSVPWWSRAGHLRKGGSPAIRIEDVHDHAHRGGLAGPGATRISGSLIIRGASNLV